MHIVSYIQGGRRQAGRLENGVVRPLISNGAPVTVEDLLAAGPGSAEAMATGTEELPFDQLQLTIPVARPGKIFCVGLNFRDHAAEGGHAIPDYPALFMRSVTSLVPHGEPMIRPLVSERFDYEAELMVVIGRKARKLTEGSALDAVFGYTIFNDGSVRDYQRKSAQWTAGKNFDRTGGIGPAIVTADALPDGAEGLSMKTRVDGEVLQDATTSDMIFPVAKVLEIITEFATLEPGDMIAMGTPAGVGHARKPPRWLKAGDTCEIEIEGLGILRNPVADETEEPLS